MLVLDPTYKLITLLVGVADSGAFLIFGGGLVALICGLVGGTAKPAIKK